MFSKINNWHLSLLVISISLLSLVLIQQKAFSWEDPYTNPGDTNLDSILFNPLGQHVILNDHIIYNNSSQTGPLDQHLDLSDEAVVGLSVAGSSHAGYFMGNVYITGDLSVEGNVPDSYWKLNTSTSSGLNALYYWEEGTSTPVGIGTKDPKSLLHIYSDHNADLTVESGRSGDAKLVLKRYNLFTSALIQHARKYNDTFAPEWQVGLLDHSTDYSIKWNSFWGGTQSIILLPDQGNVGIGTSTPNSLLHIYKASGDNAELDIQSIAGTDKHWAIYQERYDDPATPGSDHNEAGDLRFWNNDGVEEGGGRKNILTITNDGRVGLNTTTPQYSASLTVFNDRDGGTGMEVYSTDIHGNGITVNSNSAFYGIYAKNSHSSSGTGIYGQGNIGIWGAGSAYAGYFDGNVSITSNLSVGNNITADGDIVSTSGFISGLGIGISPGDGLREVEALKILDSSLQSDGVVDFPQYESAMNTLTLYADRSEIDTYAKGDPDVMWWSANSKDPESKMALGLAGIFPVSIVAMQSDDNGDNWYVVDYSKVRYIHCDKGVSLNRVEVSGLSAARDVYVQIFFKTYPTTWGCGFPLPPDLPMPS